MAARVPTFLMAVSLLISSGCSSIKERLTPQSPFILNSPHSTITPQEPSGASDLSRLRDLQREHDRLVIERQRARERNLALREEALNLRESRLFDREQALLKVQVPPPASTLPPPAEEVEEKIESASPRPPVSETPSPFVQTKPKDIEKESPTVEETTPALPELTPAIPLESPKLSIDDSEDSSLPKLEGPRVLPEAETVEPKLESPSLENPLFFLAPPPSSPESSTPKALQSLGKPKKSKVRQCSSLGD